VSDITKSYKEQLDLLNVNLKNEITNLTQQNSDLIEQYKNSKASYDKFEFAYNKEKTINNSLGEQLQESIKMHESEICMRLKFESKLNNMSAM